MQLILSKTNEQYNMCIDTNSWVFNILLILAVYKYW